MASDTFIEWVRENLDVLGESVSLERFHQVLNDPHLGLLAREVMLLSMTYKINPLVLRVGFGIHKLVVTCEDVNNALAKAKIRCRVRIRPLYESERIAWQ